jgi:hypothetical protein
MISPFFDHEGRVVSLLGRIESAEINLLADQLLRLETANSDAITLYVSSVGGDLVEALKIVDLMNTLHSHVTAVAMGLVQAAGVVIFASAPERLILPSALLSTADLWTIPALEVSPAFGFRPMGLQPREMLMSQLETQVDKLSSPALARLVREAATTPRLFTAEQAVASHLADTVVPTRNFIKSAKSKILRHVR